MKHCSKFQVLCFVALFFLGLFGLVISVRAASLYISPASGSFGVGSTFTVTVRTDTQGQSINTTEASISFSTDTLQLVRVTASPTFYLQAPGSPAQGNGTAYFGGGLPTPGYTGGNGVVGSMTFRALREGPATVSVTSGRVLLNDGQGTDALTGTAGARYTIVPPPVGAPEVSSTSHPDEERWYSLKDLALSWSRPEGAYGFSFELDQNPDTVPDNTLDTTVTTTKTYPGLADGIWYFHVKARRQAGGAGFGNTVHFRVQIDTEPPKLFDIKLVGQADLNDVTRTPTITFAAEDPGGSGIDHYDVQIDNEAPQANATSPYTFSKLEAGPHLILVTVFDKAGNSRKSQLPIIVTAPPPPVGFLARTFELPFYVLVVINLIILLLLVIILWLLLHRRRKPDNVDKKILELQNEVDKSLDHLKKHINKKLLRLLEKSGDVSNTDILTTTAIKGDIGEAKEKIDSELTKLSEAKRARKVRRPRVE